MNLQTLQTSSNGPALRPRTIAEQLTRTLLAATEAYELSRDQAEWEVEHGELSDATRAAERHALQTLEEVRYLAQLVRQLEPATLNEHRPLSQVTL
jgi:hypothetical protein